MKKLSIFDKFIFFLNILFSTALLLAYILPYIPPKTFPFLSILSLGIPILLISNIIFLIYWSVKLKKQLILSLLVLVLGFNHIISLYRVSETIHTPNAQEIKLMSYNVRQFNRFNWIKNDSVTEQIIQFVGDKSPDILCVQDYYHKENVRFKNFKEEYIELKGNSSKFGQAIFSNYPIINKGSLDFQDTYNNAIYADLKIGNDTVRVFNVHLESLKLIPEVKKLQEEDSDKLIHRVGKSFRKQQSQTELVLKKIKETPYKTIICGDLNNSAFSYVYRKLSEGYTDAFTAAGNGFGETYVFDFIPLRIDVMLIDPAFQVNEFKNFDVHLSDHYPIMSRLSIKTEKKKK
ncbi:endonuclease/exonuclease/phosphatase family protein [Mesonia maritima]|uniref:Endonuclease/exonuclease/phosphatase family metal-dependent hydrolase n=1 Tax=Mesonia maritima TaxID=1793873 RepID=A0ABU1K6S1_9FLAO|nr:endonuclease/exonuclease/phosphatase family protein [Mesonia maritima]MDR6300283.1 endonuclease/exonuclease/phosphatase family metal-dependent hydrolase [Mesonia maritima]